MTTIDRSADQWDRTLVKNAIIYAYRVLRAQPGIKRPAGLRAYWPGEDAGVYWDERQNRTRLHPKPHEISQSDAVLVGIGSMPSWLRWLEDHEPDLARVLATWAIWMSNDGYLGRQRVSEEEFARTKLRMALATFKRHRDRAAAIIAIWLQKNKVVPWVAPRPRETARTPDPCPRFMRSERAESAPLGELRATAPARRETVARK